MATYKRAIYAGSFDPFTNGHLWIAEQSAKLFDEVIIAIGENPDKNYTFSLAKRLLMLKKSVGHLNNVKVEFFSNKFLANYAKEKEAGFIVRGIRNTKDFEFEKSIKIFNEEIFPSLQTIFLIPPKDLSEVSSSFVKSLKGPEGWENIVKKLVPNIVFEGMLE